LDPNEQCGRSNWGTSAATGLDLVRSDEPINEIFVIDVDVDEDVRRPAHVDK